MKTKADLMNPFPGLRSFRSDEDYLFFGREEQTLELVMRLQRNRFIAVVGTSGRGKSSLVRCGLLSRLQGGGMVEAGAHWEIAVMHPGGDPLSRLAEALLEADLYDREAEDALPNLLATLGRSQFGLIEAVRQASLPVKTNFLLVVDQFEEIFRYDEAGRTESEVANDFIAMLREASAQTEVPIYIVTTMRSDFIGDCSRFDGLAEMVNRGEYLIPGLNRDQFKVAIEGPIRVAGGQLAPRLLQRLLNDLGDEQDQLPCLQHALMRTWRVWQTRPDAPALDLEDYAQVGKMTQALSLHADEVLVGLATDRQRDLCAAMFKALTVEGSEKRGIRRPRRLQTLCGTLGVEPAELTPVIDAFRHPEVSFLMPPLHVPLRDTTVIDLSHESLMRVWSRLRDWVDTEANSVGIFRRLSESSALWRQGKSGFYREPELSIARAWVESSRPNAIWAEQYNGNFEEAMAFLHGSSDAADRDLRAQKSAQQRELEHARDLATAQKQRADALRTTAKRRKHFSLALAVLSFGLLLGILYSIGLRNEAIEGKEQVRKNFFVTQLAQVDYQMDLQRSQKALDALKAIKPENEIERRLVTTRLLSSVSDTFYPRQRAELYNLGKRSTFPNGGVVSKDGRFVSIGADYDSRGNVHVIDLLGKHPELHFTKLESVLKAEYNFAGNLYAVGYKYQSKFFTSVFDVENGVKMELDLELSHSPLKLSFDQAGLFLAVITVNGDVHLVDCRSKNLKPVQILATGRRCLEATFSRDSSALFLISEGDPNQYVEKFSLSGGEWHRETSAHIALSTDKVDSIASVWSKKKEEIVLYGQTVSEHPVLQCLDATTLRLKNRVNVSNYHKSGAINTLLLSHDGTMVISPCLDNTCSVSDYETGALLHTFEHSANVYYACLSPNQQMLMVGDWLGFRIWDPYSGKPLTSYVKLGEGMRGAQFLEEGKILRIVTMNSRVLDYEVSGLPPQNQKIKDITSALVVNDGDSLILGDRGGVSEWTETQGAYRKKNELKGFNGTSHIIRGSSEKNVAVLDYTYPDPSRVFRYLIDATGRLEPRPRLIFPISSPNDSDVKLITVSPDGKFLVYPDSSLRVINVYSLETGEKLKSLEYPYNISCIEFSKDCKTALIFGTPDRITLIDLATLEVVNNLKHLTRYGGALRFDASGEVLASFGSGEKKGMLWRYKGPSEVSFLAEFFHEAGICSLDFSADSKTMATGAQDGTINIWDLSTLAQPLRLKRQIQQDAEIAAVRFTGDKQRTILACDEKASVRIWDIEYGVVEAGPFKMGESEVPQVGARYEFDLFGKVFSGGKYVFIIAQGSPMMIQKIPKLGQESALSAINLQKTIEVFTGWGGSPGGSLSVGKIKQHREDIVKAHQGTLIAQYLDWYMSEPSTRSIAPFQSIPLKTFVEDNLYSEDLLSISQILRLDPASPSAHARFGQLYLTNANHGSVAKRLAVGSWYASQAASKLKDGEASPELSTLQEALKAFKQP